MKTHKNHHFRQILAASLALSSSFSMISPVLAQQAAAGTDITNKATATFEDATGTKYNATSNEVVITVAEIAGITITAESPSNASPSAGDDTAYVDFVITNTGNDPTQFFIPGTATLSNTTAFQLSPTRKIQIVAVNGTPLTTPKDVPAEDAATGDAALLGTTQGSIAPNGTITVRVPIKVLPGAAAGETLTVSLGNTTDTEPASNTDASKGQNLDRSADVDTNDVYTKDNLDTAAGETAGTPVIVREAMATSTAITIGARQQAFSTVLKAVSSYSTGAKSDDVSDDVLTYALALKVENPTPPTGLITSDLYGTKINGLDPAKAYVLVSDAIPTGMKLGTVNTASLPTGWQAVYTTDPLATTALNANWSTTASGKITRVGFVYDTSTAPLTKGAPAITGLSFTVTPDTGFTSGQVANIAQVFGQSKPGAVVPGTSTQIVYDESGDQSFNNNLGGNNPDPANGGTPAANGGISDGKADPTLDGTDPGTYDPTNPATQDPTNPATNKGTDPGTGSKAAGGEDTIFSLAKTPLNGPNGQPEAIGPSDNNDDFTNKSIEGINKPSNESLTDAETPAVTFENTVKNTSGSPQEITLLPTPPTGTDILIDGTKVTITSGGQTASYTYTGGAFVADTGTTAPVKIVVSVVDPNDATKGVAQYTVKVDLPGAPQFTGYSVPITAFVDVNKDGLPTGEPSNITIDRVYTNYLKLEKKARLLDSSGNTLTGTEATASAFTTDQSILSPAATPGRIIEYQITYTNVSSGGGTNSVILPANNLVITENGSTGNNTWFSLTLDPKYPTPANGTATNTGGGTIAVTPAANGAVTDIQIYTNTVTTVVPAGTGTFTFQRKIKSTPTTNPPL